MRSNVVQPPYTSVPYIVIDGAHMSDWDSKMRLRQVVCARLRQPIPPACARLTASETQQASDTATGTNDVGGGC
jgi:hypothetical protein